jgi:hypothetical protein
VTCMHCRGQYAVCTVRKYSLGTVKKFVIIYLA